MNSFFALLGLESWKPLLTALMLPPVPLLLIVLIGARLLWVRRAAGWLILSVGLVAIWLSACNATARMLQPLLLDVPAPLAARRMAQLRSEAKRQPTSAIVVLGGGLEPTAPEYGTSNLTHYSLERLRYAIWLGRETGLPVAFSGGAGWAQPGGNAEADVAARIAAQDFNRPLRWTENASRDTHENAINTVPLLKRSGITHIVLVTHGWHMPRALRQFEEAGRHAGTSIEPAPMGLATQLESNTLEWMPGGIGYARVRSVLREWLGRLLGA